MLIATFAEMARCLQQYVAGLMIHVYETETEKTRLRKCADLMFQSVQVSKFTDADRAAAALTVASFYMNQRQSDLDRRNAASN